VNWLGLLAEASDESASFSGYYNHNVRLHSEVGEVIVRIPIAGAERMDLRLWHEPDILRSVSKQVAHAPRLLYSSNDPEFQVHSFVSGVVLNDICPRGVPVPSHVLADVVQLFVELSQIHRADLPDLPTEWPMDDDSVSFGQAVSSLTQRIWESFKDPFAGIYDSLGFPAGPLDPVASRWPSLTARRSSCLHSDVHRKNIIVDADRSFFLDWELALWGDPLYDLAVHLHKMAYQPDEWSTVVKMWEIAMNPELTRGGTRDLDVYLAHEQIKSAIVDTVRSCFALADPSYSPDRPDEVVHKLVSKLNNAHRRWQTGVVLSTPEVEGVLRSWQGRT
jgi:aminoglycoside phosphotransferase (APT) family kinase protein